MRVLLTGSTGFLGKHVAHALAGAGHELRLLARESSNLDGLPPGEIVRGDVTDRESLRRAAEGCGAICHLAALVKTWVPDPSRFDAVNVQGLRHVLEAARDAGARLVYTSSFIAIGPAGPQPADESRVHPGDRYRNDYERTKAQADALARAAAAAGQDVVMLYPGVIYGPGELTEGNIVVKLVMDHARGRMPAILGPGDRLWSYAYVDDVADGHVRALEIGRIGEEYLLGGENAPQMRVFEIVRELTGAPLPRRLPYAVAAAAARLEEARARLTGRAPLITRGVVEILRHDWSMDSRGSIDELGYRTTPLESGLKALLESFSSFLLPSK